MKRQSWSGRKDESVSWLPALCLTFGLVMSVGLIALIAFNGVRVFWPRAAVCLSDPTGSGGQVYGLVMQRGVHEENGTPWIEVVRNRRESQPMRVDRISYGTEKKPTADPEIVVIESSTLGMRIGVLESLQDASGNVHSADTAGFKNRLEQAFKRSHEQRVGEEDADLRLLHYRGDFDELHSMALLDVERISWPNNASLWEKLGFFAGSAKRFLLEFPRAANTEGGVFPAIVGTLLVTVLMSIAVAPLGVLAALYLHEYSKQGPFVRAVRVSVNNLAGVPSIVFGVFGLGFFVYGVGGSIDGLFFPGRDGPVFGTGGILWASLTLALLTVPVVIVATEEALAAVPTGIRDASFACGASRWQTTWRIVLPAASPGMLTGLILAMARGAGEVAPIMLVGAVQMAPQLPIDGSAPWLHLDRKFMHLGFHIYDLAFQSPDARAVQPMVFATALLLIALVLLLNGVALTIRARLREHIRRTIYF